MPDENAPAILSRPDGAAIAYRSSPGAAPGVMFCGGLMSDMEGTKATALEAHCRAGGRAYVRFDYRGHGQSSGVFHQTTLGEWAGDALAVLDELTTGPMIVVGSSMGGWVMLLLALRRPERVAGLVGIAPAPDFIEEMWNSFDDEAKQTLRRDGVYARPSKYSDDPYMISMKLIEEGRDHMLLDKPIPIHCPVRLLHGMEDPDVPWRHSLKIAEQLESNDVTITFTTSGDPRLSEPDDIARLLATVDELVAKAG